MDNASEDLIRKFAGMLTIAGPSTALTISDKGIGNKNLSLCLLVRAITDRPYLDQALIDSLLRAWNVHPETSFEAQGGNQFLVEFSNHSDLTYVLTKGPWQFRQDFLAYTLILGPEDLASLTANTVQFWIQLHNIPSGALSDEGVYEVASNVGSPCSLVTTAFFRSKKFYKVKIERDVIEPLPETIDVTYLTLPNFTVYIIYEKLHRFCNFCAQLGHESDTCQDYNHLFRTSKLPAYQNREDLQQILKKKTGQWLTNPALIPR